MVKSSEHFSFKGPDYEHFLFNIRGIAVSLYGLIITWQIGSGKSICIKF